MRETDLYPPVKAFLEGQGYDVKGEIGAADVVALRGDEPPVIVELKTGFSLALVHQGIDRQTMTPHVYLAVPDVAGKRGLAALRANLKLARRLGLGVITVRLSDGLVTVHCDPGPFQPRLQKKPRERLLREFASRRGDPAQGGATRDGLVTAYRQDAMELAAHLAEHGPCKGSAARDATGVARATAIMRDNHYGWFEKVSTGIYALSEAGRAALPERPAREAPRMRVILLTALAMAFFAANSLLTRAGVLDGTDPLVFAAIRVGSSALVLAVLARGRGLRPGGGARWAAAACLAGYLLGFSLAYRSLDAGLGALLLFATVQLTLFAAGIRNGDAPGCGEPSAWCWPWRVWSGCSGPGGRRPLSAAPMDVGLMIGGGLAWAGYTLAGRSETRPLEGSAANFLLASGAFALAAPLWLGAPITVAGALLAVVSGALASGIGYAIWFRVLPGIDRITAGLVQLTVPVLAMAGGAFLLAEIPAPRALAAAALVLAGIALSVSARPARVA